MTERAVDPVDLAAAWLRGRVARLSRMPDDTSWDSRHFSLANPKGRHSTDLPRLLRAVADEIERQQIAPDELLTVHIDSEVTDRGPWWSALVVWSPDQH